MPSRSLSREEAKRLLAERPSRRTSLTGAAGEYFVAAELSLLGWLATVTIKNAPGTDVLAQHSFTQQLVAIQTKTASPGSQFRLNVKCEPPTAADNQWYVFVKLHESPSRPSFYVVPHNVVSGAVFASHRAWLARPGRGGRMHKDTPLRSLTTAELAGYEDKWQLLEGPTEDAPLLIEPYFDELVKAHGLPDGHPGWPKRI